MFFIQKSQKILRNLPFIFTALLLVAIGLSFVAPSGARANAFFLPSLTATKTDSLQVDVDNDTQPDPGDTLRYTVVLANAGPDAASGVTFDDTIDANTTLVGGSLHASSLAINDTFPVTVVGNVSIDSANLSTPFSVVSNDFLGLNPTATISAFDATTTNGGTVSMTTSGAGLGQFTYNPPVGFEGVDTFTYTLSDNPNASSAVTNRQGTVSITVSGMVWFINNSAPACTVAGCGRLSNPFSTLAAFNALNDNGGGNHPGNNDNIFIYESATGYSGAVTLLTGQKLIGQDATASLSTITGLTPPTGSSAFPAMNSGNGTETSLANTVTLNTNVTVRGLRIDSTTTTAMNDPVAAITGVSVSEVKIATTTGTGVNFSGTAGTLNFIGLTTTSGTGANLTSNSGGTFTFSSVTISSGANPAFVATGGGTVNVCDENPCNPSATGTLVNTLTSTTGTALNIADTTIGANNLEFRNISSNGAVNGIVLTNTGSSGGLKVKGNSTGNCGGTVTVNSVGIPATVGAPVIGDCTGGTIQNSTGHGIVLNNTANVSLTRIYIVNSGQDGINALSLNGFTLANSFVTDGSGGVGDRGLEFGDFSTGTPINGAINLTNSTVGPTPHDNFGVGIASGTSTWNINSTVFTGSTLNSGLNFEVRNATVSSLLINNSVFQNQFADGLQINPGGGVSATITNATIQNSTFTGNNLAMDLDHDGTSNVTFYVLSNTFLNHNSHAINFFSSASPGTGGTMTGRFINNVIGNAALAGSGSAIGNGLRININGGADATVLVDANTIRQTPNGRGIEVISRNGTGGLDITVTNNTVNPDDTSGFPLSAIFLQSNCVGTCNTLRADVRANTVPAGATFDLLPTFIALVETSTSTCELVDTPPASANATAQLTSVNTGSASASAGCALIAGPINQAFIPTSIQVQAPEAETLANGQTTDLNAGQTRVGKPTHAQPVPGSALLKPAQSPLFSGENINFAIGTLPSGKSVTVIFDVTIDDPFPAASNPACNQATITSNELSPVLTDNPDTATPNDATCVIIPINADLAITKTDGVTTEVPGTSVTYTIVASNAGPNDDPAAVVADTFPGALTGVTWTCVGAGGGTCTASGSGNINETVNLPVGGSVTFTATGTINPAATGSLSNTATIAPSNGITDPVLGNNSATDTDTLTPQADVNVTKTDGQSSDIPGTSISYTITASNSGPSDAPGTTLADTFPASLTSVTWTCVGAGGGTCTANGSGNISDTVNLPAGGSVTYTINATISASATGTLSNTATVSSGITDPNPANNSATDTTTLTPQADLSITKTDGVATAIPGGSVTYTIVASNVGPSNSPSVTVADTFPASLTATWTCVGAGGGTCTAAGSGDINDMVNLPAGGSVTYTVNATIASSATGTLSNTATVSSGITDPDPGNNSATDTDTLTPQADLAITKTDGVTTATPGGSVTYTITASNAGPSDVTGATVADTFPASLTATWTCVGAGGGTCTAAGSGNINDTVNLPAGGSVTFTVTATINPAATGTLSNTATVTSGGTDPNPGNNSATDTDTLAPQADISITKTDGLTSATPGTGLTYTIVASNAGPSNAPSVTIADTFPADLTGITWTCVASGGGTCTANGSGNLNDTANLPAGASVTYTINATISASATGTLSNTATVSVGGGVTDPNAGNNSATDTTTLIAQADLAITKADSAEPVPPGSPLTYTLSITNTGPSTALNVLVTDTLPTEVTWTGDTCTAGPPAGQTLVWNVGTLSSGSSLSCQVYVTVNSAGGGLITNNAIIGSDVLDPNPVNNTATESTITNVPPTLANVVITSPINENGTATLSGIITDPDTGDTFTLVVDWGDGSAPQTFNYAAGTTAFSETHQYLDDNPTGTAADALTVGLTLSDSAGNTDLDSTSVTVNNLAPTLSNVAVTSPINENGTATLTGNFADTGTLDTFTLVVDWGDGSAPQTFNYAAGTTAFSETHTYTDDNPSGNTSNNYTISLTLTDDDTGSDTDSTSVTVNNVGPTLSSVAATATNENGSTTLTGTITDPGTGDTFTLVVDWGDGTAPQTFNYSAGTTAFSETHAYLDDNPTGTASDNYTISMTLTDDDTGSDTDSTSVTVNNLAPTLSNVAITGAVDEGGAATLTGNLADTGTLDSFTLVVNWGDGSTPQTFNYPAGTNAFSETHVYADDDPTGTTSDPVTVNLTLTDDDTGSDNDTATHTVNNVAPTLSNVSITNPVNEGGIATLTGSITDPGTGDTFTLVVDWGDGSAPETFSYAAGATAFTESHVFVDDNPTSTSSDNYLIGLTLADDDTGSDTDSTTIIVNNVVPGLTITYPVAVANENAPFTVVGQIADPGIADTFTFVADWADGAVVTYTYPSGTTVFTVTHVYADDNPTGTPADLYSPSYTLTDDDTGSVTVTPATPITVNNVAPALSNLAATSVDENGLSTLTGTITDASAQDSFSLTVAWGDGSVFTFTYPAGTTVFTETHLYLDDAPSGTPADSYTVTLTLTDDDTGVGTGTAPLTVTNLAPALSQLNVIQVDENNLTTLSGFITDTGTLDTFTLLVDWGDGLTDTFNYPAGTGAFTETHTYLDGLLTPLITNYTITLTLTDDDTGQDAETIVASVNNVAPTITSLAATSPVNENGTTTLIGTFTDPGTQDTFTVVVDWGDGSVLTATYPAGAFDLMHTHQYLDDDPTATTSDTYSITVTLTDDEGGTDTDGTAITINNLAPTVNAGPAQTVADTAPVSFSGVFTDAGTLDTHTVLWDFGDGITNTGTLTPTHTFPGAGTYTVSLTVTDDDTGIGTDTLAVTVLPSADLGLTKQTIPGPILSGAEVVYTLTVSNLGPSEASGVIMTDTLPAGVMFASASSGCTETGGLVACTVGVLPNGDSASVQILVTVAVDYEGILTNTAQVESLSADPDLTNNTASAAVEAVQTLIVFEDDFEDPPMQDEWGCATPVTSTTPIGARNFLGEFGPETVCLSLSSLPEHAYVNVAFDLFIIRSWDGNQVEIPPSLQYLGTDPIVGPDTWLFKAEGATLLETTFTNWVGQMQAYPGSIPDGDYPSWAGAVEIATLGYTYFDLPQDSVYHLEFTFAHAGSTLDLEFISQQLQDVFDESWGLDNVVVTISMTDSFGETYTIYLPIILH